MAAWRFSGEAECRRYLRERVAPRLRASEGTAILAEYLADTANTGFDLTLLREQVCEPPRPKDWEVGETLAEVLLEDRHGARFPWPTALDKRAPRASLPGPDIVGFHLRPDIRFLFGEVKSSSEDSRPPQVVTQTGDGLIAQVRRLLTSEEHRQQLVAWLLVKSQQGNEWNTTFDAAVRRYFFAPRPAWVVGVLVRGGVPAHEEDIRAVVAALEEVETPFDVAVFAFYLPFPKERWPELLEGGGVAS